MARIYKCIGVFFFFFFYCIDVAPLCARDSFFMIFFVVSFNDRTKIKISSRENPLLRGLLCWDYFPFFSCILSLPCVYLSFRLSDILPRPETMLRVFWRATLRPCVYRFKHNRALTSSSSCIAFWKSFFTHFRQVEKRRPSQPFLCWFFPSAWRKKKKKINSLRHEQFQFLNLNWISYFFGDPFFQKV